MIALPKTSTKFRVQNFVRISIVQTPTVQRLEINNFDNPNPMPAVKSLPLADKIKIRITKHASFFCETWFPKTGSLVECTLTTNE